MRRTRARVRHRDPIELMTADTRRLRDLRSVGPATVQDLALLGVTDVATLAGCDPQALYDRLCAITGVRQDPCVLDVLACAVAQARDPGLPAERREWWWWSRVRKSRTSSPGGHAD